MARTPLHTPTLALTLTLTLALAQVVLLLLLLLLSQSWWPWWSHHIVRAVHAYAYATTRPNAETPDVGNVHNHHGEMRLHKVVANERDRRAVAVQMNATHWCCCAAGHGVDRVDPATLDRAVVASASLGSTERGQHDLHGLDELLGINDPRKMTQRWQTRTQAPRLGQSRPKRLLPGGAPTHARECRRSPW